MKRTAIAVLSAAALSLGGTAWAAKVEPGKPLPVIKIDDEGLMKLTGDDVSYSAFSTASLKGKVHCVLVIAGQSGASEINTHFTNALAAAKLDLSKFQNVSIIDVDQAVFGTGGIVQGRIEDKQKTYPKSKFVIDDDGVAVSKWELSEDGYAVIVLDKAGKVLRFKDGKLSGAEVKDFIAIIKQAMAQ